MIEMIEVDALDYRRVMAENKRLKKDNEELEYLHSMALAREAVLKIKIYDSPGTLWKRIWGVK